MTQTGPHIFLYRALAEQAGEADWLVTLPDWPEAAGGGASFLAAVADAEGALEEAALNRLAEGRPWPQGAGRIAASETGIALSAYAVYRAAVVAWARRSGRGAEAELARRLGKDARHARRILDVNQRVSLDSLEQACRAIGFQPVHALALPSGGALATGEPARAAWGWIGGGDGEPR